MSPQVKAISMEQLDQEFQSILESIAKLNLTKSEIYKALSPVRWQLFLNTWIKKIKLAILLLVCTLAIYSIPLVNWNASAIGRLAMVQILPYWDWRPLYKDRCLIKSFISKAGYQESSYYNNEPLADDCSVCENIGSIFKMENVSFDHLNERHLQRSLPVVISDSHLKWKDRSRTNLTQFFEEIEPLLLSSPCNVQTNLIFNPRASVKLNNALTSLFDILNKSGRNESWFLHFRNCELKTVKQTRLLFERPYFYDSHLEMPYTTWVLLSKNYKVEMPKMLKLEGLIIIMQLKLSLQIILAPKGPCHRICKELEVELHEGQSLVFLTNLWTFEYLPSARNETSITFISETLYK
ncbi:uncharacterized protein LOC131683710 [Topomyia yanbarensis]|uniref:uncharacterized protein LOC131683710 n=1 Tax=Topomyia yanbarensis TaxID=2498891 RepID=UPI00273B49A4|nr:uncharacterized protein LOC131683710 [Topomyia yanbarensis]